jgi:hypothetical protein
MGEVFPAGITGFFAVQPMGLGADVDIGFVCHTTFLHTKRTRVVAIVAITVARDPVRGTPA